MFEYNAVVTRVVDGDTLDVRVDLGFHVSVHERVRLRGIDTPEIFRPRNEKEHKHGKQAKAFVEQMVLGNSVLLKTYKDRQGKYGRWLADVIVDDVSLVHALIANGFEKKEAY